MRLGARACGPAARRPTPASRGDTGTEPAPAASSAQTGSLRLLRLVVVKVEHELAVVPQVAFEWAPAEVECDSGTLLEQTSECVEPAPDAHACPWRAAGAGHPTAELRAAPLGARGRAGAERHESGDDEQVQDSDDESLVVVGAAKQTDDDEPESWCCESLSAPSRLLARGPGAGSAPVSAASRPALCCWSAAHQGRRPVARHVWLVERRAPSPRLLGPGEPARAPFAWAGARARKSASVSSSFESARCSPAKTTTEVLRSRLRLKSESAREREFVDISTVK